jgi:hypothetical protein
MSDVLRSPEFVGWYLDLAKTVGFRANDHVGAVFVCH